MLITVVFNFIHVNFRVSEALIFFLTFSHKNVLCYQSKWMVIKHLLFLASVFRSFCFEMLGAVGLPMFICRGDLCIVVLRVRRVGLHGAVVGLASASIGTSFTIILAQNEALFRHRHTPTRLRGPHHAILYSWALCIRRTYTYTLSYFSTLFTYGAGFIRI